MYARRYNPDDEAEAIFERILAERVAQDPEWADFAERNRSSILKKISAKLRARDTSWLAERRAAVPKVLGEIAPEGWRDKVAADVSGYEHTLFAHKGSPFPMYAATGLTYLVRPIILLTNADGTGPVLASNLPSGKPLEPVGPPTPGYPVELQARSLLTPGEQAKIANIATNLDPARLLAEHSDPTLGPPVVWPMDTGVPGKNLYPVVAGNSRLVALLAAPPSRYEAYLKALAAWRVANTKSVKHHGNENWFREGMDWKHRLFKPVLVRMLVGIEGREGPVSFAEAMKLAGASQESTAGVESTIGKALSTLRALGIGDVSGLPQVANWSEAIHQDNVGAFIEANGGFWQGLLERMPAERRGHYESSDAAAAELVRTVFIGFLPAEVRQRGFGDRKTEQALVSALPGMVYLHQLVMEGQVNPGWDLLPRLALAVEVYDSLRRRSLSVEGAVKLLEQESRQVQMAGATTLLSEVSSDPLAFALAVMFKKAAGLLAPELVAERYLTPYVGSAIADTPRQEGLFGAAQAPDPASTLARIIGMRMPKLRSNPRDCGDCFEANGRYLMEHGEIAYPPRDSMRLVHGEVTGQGRLEGINFGHAWIEYDGVDEAMVLDLSNGKHMEVPRRFYYAMGGIAENDNMHVYDYDEVAEKIRRYEHWGPWDLKTSTGH